MLYVASYQINAGMSVFVNQANLRAYGICGNSRIYLGVAVENLREGFRIVERNGEVREDDA